MKLDPRQLRVLLAVVKEGSFSAAGRTLNMSQPAVSMLIAQLERTVGARLVERGRQGAEPTIAGKILTRRAAMVESVLDLAAQEVSMAAIGMQGPLVLGGTPGALMTLVPHAIEVLDRGDVGFSMRIVEAADSDLITLLRDLSIDVAVGTVGVAEAPADIIETPIMTDEFVLVMRADHAFTAPVATLEKLSGLAWVLPDTGGAFQRQIEAIFLMAGVAVPTRAVRCDSLATTKEMVRVSDRVTILPSRVVAPDLKSGSLRAVTLSTVPPPRTLGVRVLRDRMQMPLFEQIVTAMRSGGAA